jgi:acylphosphatase
MRYLVSGRVQGVCYRAFARDHALRLGLKGFTRNLPDGRVEVVAQGEPERLGEMAKALAEGPFLARVAGVDETKAPAEPRYPDFRITY